MRAHHSRAGRGGAELPAPGGRAQQKTWWPRAQAGGAPPPEQRKRRTGGRGRPAQFKRALNGTPRPGASPHVFAFTVAAVFPLWQLCQMSPHEAHGAGMRRYSFRCAQHGADLPNPRASGLTRHSKCAPARARRSVPVASTRLAPPRQRAACACQLCSPSRGGQDRHRPCLPGRGLG